MNDENKDRPPKPPWLRVRIGSGPGHDRMSKIMRKCGLHTVCEEAMCPNMGECWENGRATVMILGGICTRACGFCGVSSGNPCAIDASEPERVAESVKAMKLKDVVITSVTRDDLDDGGASVWAKTIRLVHKAVPGICIEALIPDFGGAEKPLLTVLKAGPEILGHNLETVPSLYPKMRPQADYARSLALLRRAHEHGAMTKTSIMVGVGETLEEVTGVMRDAAKAGCDIFFVGQYLRPTKKHVPVNRYVEPAEFESYRKAGLATGLEVVVSAPLVRSSYHSVEQDEYVRQALRIKLPRK